MKTNKHGNYKRVLDLDAIADRFNRHQKLHDFEVENLFTEGKKFNEIQIRYLEKGIQFQGIYDIETSDFNPLGNFIIGYVIHIRDIANETIKAYEDHISKKDITDSVAKNSFNFDSRLLRTLSEYINRCQQIVGHYSSKFDTPYFRTRCLLTKQNNLIPDYGKILQADTWRMMKTTLKAPRNTLKNFALYTGTQDQKTYVSMNHWRTVWFKDSPDWAKSMEYIMSHCRKDVAMTVRGLRKAERFNPVSMVRT